MNKNPSVSLWLNFDNAWNAALRAILVFQSSFL
jgi:hypothetical protein